MKNQNRFILGLMVIGLMSGCSSSSNHNGTPEVTGDSFMNAVRSTAVSSPEDTEPIDIDGISVTAPENGEPEAL